MTNHDLNVTMFMFTGCDPILYDSSLHLLGCGVKGEWWECAGWGVLDPLRVGGSAGVITSHLRVRLPSTEERGLQVLFSCFRYTGV